MQQRRRRTLAISAAVVLLVAMSAAQVASLIVDFWWYGEVGFRSLWLEIVGVRILLAVVFGGLLAAIVVVNLLLARRLRPLFVPSTPEQAIVERYRDSVEAWLPWIVAGVAVLFGLTSGLAVSSQWEGFQLWRHAEGFGVADPVFQRDVGFYVFQLPFLKFVQSWLFTSLLLAGVLTVGAHYVMGGIRAEGRAIRVMPGVKAHLSVLLIAILAARAWGYWLDRFLLNFSPRGTVTGASYTDVNAELPALNLLIGVTVVAVVLVAVSTGRRGFLLPGAAIGLLLVGSIVLQGAYPAAIQRLRVAPQELAREQRFIGYNLEATSAAYGLDTIEAQPFDVRDDLGPGDVDDNEVTLNNVRLWDQSTLLTTFQQLQSLRPYYQFVGVDVDRYEVDGELRQVMLSPRELQLDQLPPDAATWQNRHITYTHGYGVVASLTNTATARGQPVFLAQDIPPQGDDELVPEDRAAVYYGLWGRPSTAPTAQASPGVTQPGLSDDRAVGTGIPEYSLVGTQAAELDYEEPDSLEQVYTSYAGAGGVAIDSIFRRAVFALRFTDPNLLISSLLTDDTRVLLQRSVDSRIAAVAPFLTVDRDPYAAVVDGRIKWILDAYTTSAYYPYSQRASLNAGTGRESVNYLRNSVKAVVDAYDGTVDLYVVDDQDPVIRAWRAAFPDALRDASEAPAELVARFRYPQDLFELQAQLYATYHIPEPAAFYNRADLWQIPVDAAAAQNRPSTTTLAPPELDPYYLLMRLPGEPDEEFVLIQPYVAANRPNMVSWLAGRSRSNGPNDLFAVRFPSDATVLGPEQAQARIEQDDDISAYITLRNQSGSRVIRGNLIVLPVADSILYIEPLFLTTEANIPQLERVVIVIGEQVVFDRTLAGAIGQLVGVDPGETGIEEERDPIDEDAEPAPPADLGEDLLRQALEAFAAADEALAAGDLGRYQDLIQGAGELLERAAAEQGITLTPEPTQVPTAAPTG